MSDLNEIRVMIHEEMKPVHEFISEQMVLNQKFGQTLYGSEGEGGIKHALELHGDRLTDIEKNQNQGVGRRTIFTALGGGTLGYLLTELKHLFNK